MIAKDWTLVTKPALRKAIENLWAEECAYSDLMTCWLNISEGNGAPEFLIEATKQAAHYAALETSAHEERQRAIAILERRALTLDKWGRIKE